MKKTMLYLILILMIAFAIWLYFAISECFEVNMVELSKISCNLGDCVQLNFCKVFNKNI